MALFSLRARMSMWGMVGRGAPGMLTNNRPPRLLQWPDEPHPAPQLPSSFSHGRSSNNLLELEDTFGTTSSWLKKKQKNRPMSQPLFSRNRPPTRLPHPFLAARHLQPQRPRTSVSPAAELATKEPQIGPGRTWLLPIGRYLERSGGASRAAVEWAGRLFRPGE